MMTGAISRAIHSVDPELPLFDIFSMEERMHESLARRRFSTLLLGIFAGFAVILAAIGVYGVMTYSVERQVREIGVRMMLGAEPNNILRLVVQQASVLVSVGIGIGIAGAFALTRVLSGFLFGVSSTDLTTFTVVPLLLSAIALLAGYAPARRATKVDPAVAVRCE
jgi:putative ABC transport system permease protein